MNPIRLPDRPRILVVAMRRLGDVLLTTPLIRSLKRALPQASIDALVFAGTEGILAGNPDLAGVLTIAQRPRLAQTLALLRRLAKRYDLALSTQTGDRPTFPRRHRRTAKRRPDRTGGLGRRRQGFCTQPFLRERS